LEYRTRVMRIKGRKLEQQAKQTKRFEPILNGFCDEMTQTAEEFRELFKNQAGFYLAGWFTRATEVVADFAFHSLDISDDS